MKKMLPLFNYATTWIYVDDDRILLNAISLALREYSALVPFESSKECLDFFKKYSSPLKKHIFLKSITNDEFYGRLQHAPVDFDVTMLAKLADDPNRFHEVTAMVIDYNMPEMDGFSLAKACNSLPMGKILLTGKSIASEAIAGFNKDLIHRFVQKGQVETEEILVNYLKELSLRFFQKITAPLLSYLETENLLPLSDPIFIEFFENYCRLKNIKEYYLIDKQGSFLLIDGEGERSYLIVASEHYLESWSFSYSKESDFPENLLMDLKERKKIPFFGIGKEAWQFSLTDWPKYFFPASTLQGRETYFWAHHPCYF